MAPPPLPGPRPPAPEPALTVRGVRGVPARHQKWEGAVPAAGVNLRLDLGNPQELLDRGREVGKREVFLGSRPRASHRLEWGLLGRGR